MSDSGKVNILLVDDQPAKLLSYEAILGELHENLIKAGSAHEALQQLLKNDVAVVLVDACMPEMDGFELAQMIRNHPRCDKTSIILVSAVYMSEFDRLRGYGCGAVDYVPVPVVPDVLRAKVSIFADLYRKTELLSRMNTELERRVVERTAELEASTAELRESERRYRELVLVLPAAVYSCDAQGRVMLYNNAAAELWGRKPEVGKELWCGAWRIYRLDGSPLSFEECPMAIAIREGRTIRGEEFVIERPDGSRRHVMPHPHPICDASGRVIGAINMLMDITDRKIVEEEKAALLMSEQKARTAAENANRLKDDFLATLSHELRTPINAVLGWVHLMHRGRLDVATTEEGLEAIERGVRTQVRLIDELLDVNRISSGKFRISEDDLDLSDVLNPAIDTIMPEAHDKGVAVVRAGKCDGIRLRGDVTRLQQVFWNLLSNAAKFTPGGGRIETRVEQSNSHVQISVVDTGQGIKPEFLPHIFERFRQADSSTTRHHGGLGLGLAIAKHIVDLHRGSILAESDGDGKGARFIVTLPVSAINLNATCPPPPADALSIDLGDISVLIVDDDDATRKIVSRTLSEHGATSRTAGSADEALEILSTWPTDVLVCDIGMPGKDGYALIRAARARPGGDVPAVALTAYTRPEDRARALEAGYDAHLSKPINPHELVVAVSKLSMLAAARRSNAPA